MLRCEQMVDHDPQDVAHAGIGHRVDDLLALSFTAQDARGPQEPQVVACQRRRDPQFVGDVAGRNLTLHTGHNNREARWVRKQAEGLGKLGSLVGLHLDGLHDQTIKHLFDCCQGKAPKSPRSREGRVRKRSRDRPDYTFVRASAWQAPGRRSLAGMLCDWSI